MDEKNKELYSIFSNATIKLSGTTLTIVLKNTSTINYLVLHIKVGAHSYGNSSSVYNENSISDAIAKSCSKSSSTGSITTSSKPNKSSKSSKSKKSSKLSKTNKSNKSHTKYKKSAMKNILKLITWSAIISFIMYIFKNKINGTSR